MKHTLEELRNITYKNRRRFLELFTKLGYGHVTSAFSWAEISTILYYEVMNFSEENSDRMVVSKGHGAGMLFPVFEDLGWISREEMENILKVGGDNRKIKKFFCPGFDFYGGSLGMGIAMAVGLAKGDKLNNSSRKTFCILGDAECYEGSVWEAIHLAGHLELDNLIVIVDRNFLGCSDFTEHMLRLEPFKEKWIYSGWEVNEVDGHNLEMIYKTLSLALSRQKSGGGGSAIADKPQCIIANTKKGQGLPYTVDKPLLHGFMPKSQEEIERAFKELEY